MTTRTPPRGRVTAVLRSPWLAPAGWLVGVVAATALVLMPREHGPLGLLAGGLSALLGVVLVVSVLAVALALVAPALRSLARWPASVATARAARSQDRPS